MKTKRNIEEIIDHGENIILEGVTIDKKEYSLSINNHEGRLVLSFNGEEYKIMIKEGEIIFERHLYRPNHDHDDTESLQILEARKAIAWRARYPYSGEGFDFFKVKFGAETTQKD